MPLPTHSSLPLCTNDQRKILFAAFYLCTIATEVLLDPFTMWTYHKNKPAHTK